MRSAICELASGAGRIAASEVVRAEVLVAGAVAEHVIDGGQDRGGNRNSRFLGAAASLEAQELGFEVASVMGRSESIPRFHLAAGYLLPSVVGARAAT